MTSPDKPETLREEIERRVQAFRDRQRRFNDARDSYFKQTLARLRADLARVPHGAVAKPDPQRTSPNE